MDHDEPSNSVETAYVTNPVHGGKVTCHKCVGFIKEEDLELHKEVFVHDEYVLVPFHKNCYNRWEHYYGLDKPLD